MSRSKRDIMLLRRQLDRKLRAWKNLPDPLPPRNGWIQALRKSLGMNLHQLARRLKINPATLARFEEREVKGTISLNTLREVAKKMHCRLVYALVPAETLEAAVDRQAQKTARKILQRTSHSMALEVQETAPEEQEHQILDLAHELKRGTKRIIWDE